MASARIDIIDLDKYVLKEINMHPKLVAIRVDVELMKEGRPPRQFLYCYLNSFPVCSL
jgi:hypothetical protein